MQIPSKSCSRCRETKPLGDFAWRYTKLGLQDSYCRPCRSAYKKEHYQRNKDRYRAQALDYKQRIHRQRTEWLLDFFLIHPCVDCAETDPIVLEFDHSEGKDFNISSGLLNKAWSVIVAEIAKCEVVCVNCHRRRTAREQGFARLLLGEELN